MTIQYSDRAPIPMFEGQPVDACVMKITGSTPIDDGNDVIVSVDDVVMLMGQFRVTGIRHYSDEKTGKLVREQILKCVPDSGMHRVPFNPNDPNDDGVVRGNGRQL